ncbi:MAG: phage tail protein [Leptospira sp.]|nr:phage tail protein [Leptospira sp.]
MSEPKEKTLKIYRGDTTREVFYVENIDPANFSSITIRLEAKRSDNNQYVIGIDVLESDIGNDWENNLVQVNFSPASTQNIQGEDTILLRYDLEVTRITPDGTEVKSEYNGSIVLIADVTVGNPVVTPETLVDIYNNLVSTNDAKGASYIGVKSSIWFGIATTVQGALQWIKENYLEFTGTFSANKLLKSGSSLAKATVSGISISGDDELSGVKSITVTDPPSDANHLTNKDYVDDGLALKENLSNKSTNTALGGSDSLYPSQNAVKVFVENSISAASVGFLKDRGNYDASSNLFPSTGGSGPSGTIEKGNLWTISVAGTLGGTAVTIGDVVRSLVDSPGQTSSNWAIGENNFGYVAENSANKNQNSGYAGLDSSGNFVQNSDKLPEGSTNLFFTTARAIASVLTGYSATSGTISASDSILQAIQKIGYFIANIGSSILNQALTGLSLATGGTISSSDSIVVAFGKLQKQITDLVSGSVPVGTSIEFSGSTIPSGFLEEDGSAISRSTYSDLFAAIGTTYGVGDGSTTFNIPDHRGNSSRGVGTSSGYVQNVTITLGQRIDDALQGHFHAQRYAGRFFSGSGPYTTDDFDTSAGGTPAFNNRIREEITNGTDGTPRTANETRVKTIGKKFAIKY